MDENQAAKILELLRDSVALPALVKPKNDPFRTLVTTIISQNTADTNTERAFESLSKSFEITPQALANAETSAIEKCLRVAGLYKSKARTIQTASKRITQEFNGSLTTILKLPLEQARKALMEFPGVGPKTADVVLLFSASRPTIPVDTHVNRVAKRLGLAPAKGDYEAVRLSLQSFFEPKDYLAVHLLLIGHGRKYCKAVRPRCAVCTLSSYCPSKSMGAEK